MKVNARRVWEREVNTRANILGLQLQHEVAGQQVTAALLSPQTPSLLTAVEQLLQDDVIKHQLLRAKEEQTHLQTLIDLATTSTSTNRPQVSLFGHQRSRVHALAMLEHLQVTWHAAQHAVLDVHTHARACTLQDWAERLKATVANLEDVLRGPARSEFLRFFSTTAASQQHLHHTQCMLGGAAACPQPQTASMNIIVSEAPRDAPNRLAPTPPYSPAKPACLHEGSGCTVSNRPFKPQLLPQAATRGVPHAAASTPSSMQACSLGHVCSLGRPPVAHWVGTVPRKLMRALRLPNSGSGSADAVTAWQAACASGSSMHMQHALALQAASIWSSAPTLKDPDSGQVYALACHKTLDRALSLARDGDVVLLQPGGGAGWGHCGCVNVVLNSNTRPMVLCLCQCTCFWLSPQPVCPLLQLPPRPTSLSPRPGRYRMGGPTASNGGSDDDLGATTTAAAAVGVYPAVFGGQAGAVGGPIPLRCSVRVIGLGSRRQEVVIHNGEEDDYFLEVAAAPGR